jgi:hypothetical protein
MNFHYITIISISFFIIGIILKQIIAIWLDFIAENKPIASSITGIIVLSINLKQHHTLNRGPTTCLLPQQGWYRPLRPQVRYGGCMKAIQYAWQDETYRPSYQPVLKANLK